MRKICLIFVLLISGTACGQWTEPDTTACPQFGTRLRSPWISNDGLRLYLCTIDAINVTQRDSIGAPWQAIQRLPNHINMTSTQTSVCESPSGDTLYFMSDVRPEGSYGSYDIYYSIRTDTGWGPVYNCGPNVNGPGREWSVGISRDGSILLLSSGGPEGLYLDLYYCMKQPDGTWGPMTSFGDSINTREEDEYPCLSPDNTILYYYHTDENMGDIWTSRKVNGVWRRAEPLPAPVNNQLTTEMNPCMAADGRTLWFRKESGYETNHFHIVTSTDTSAVNVVIRPETNPFHEDSPGITLREGNGRILLTTDRLFPQQQGQIAIYNLLGQLAFESDIRLSAQGRATSGVIITSQLPAGSYFLTLQVGDVRLQNKFIKTK